VGQQWGLPRPFFLKRTKTTNVLRRDFLKLSGVFIASAVLPAGLTACFHKNNVQPERFPQGVASGDPRANSIVLWTRALPGTKQTTHKVTIEVALEDDFTTLVLQQTYAADEQSDFTLSVIVQDLQPDTFYYYRFINDAGESSITGRTLTAPGEINQDAFRFAFVSCQDYSHGFYKAYRQMINDDLEATDEEKIRFILHLGDFIYETRLDPLQQPIDTASHEPIQDGLTDRFGQARQVPAFPNGGVTEQGIEFADSLADYRHLYKQYLSDPDLQAARARWPFINTWDDHEFSDDCWQSEANYNASGEKSSTDEPSQPRKVAANQAWFEFIPANLSQLDDVDIDLRHAAEFQFAEVDNTANRLVNDDNLASNEDNLKAIQTLTIYRSFRFGGLFDLLVTDNRSYRSDHAVPEEITATQPGFLHPRMVMPLQLVNELDAGRTANNGDPDAFVIAGGPVFNPRYNSPPGSMLGTRQKQWWKDTLLRSESTWKFWGNSVPLMRFLADLSALGSGLPDIVISSDCWDGYPSERNELMQFLKTNDINNVVSLSGDLHGHFAGTVMDNHDDSLATETMVELVCGSISSISMFAAIKQLSYRDNPSELEQVLQKLISYETGQSTTDNPVHVNNLNNTLSNGVLASLASAATQTETASDTDNKPNPHLRYADSDGHGYGMIDVAQDQLLATIVTIDGINLDTGLESPGKKREARFTIPRANTGETASISDAEITGTPPFPITP